METQDFSFNGHVRIYLQGEGALELISSGTDCFSYFLGSSNTRIRIRDFRRLPADAARQALSGENIYQFADIFNQPALARIASYNGNVDIDIHEDGNSSPTKLLWMGVVSDGDTLPLVLVDWEVLQSTGDNRTGFAALVEE